LRLLYEHCQRGENAENRPLAVHDIVARIEALTKEDERLGDLSGLDMAPAALSDSPQPGASSSASLAGSHTSVDPLMQSQALLVPHMEHMLHSSTESTLALEHLLSLVDPSKPATAELLDFLNGGQVELYDYAEEAQYEFDEE
jgi:hypothetical protein